jgi:hypothetical protein
MYLYQAPTPFNIKIFICLITRKHLETQLEPKAGMQPSPSLFNLAQLYLILPVNTDAFRVPVSGFSHSYSIKASGMN